jgi:hypothetical protein
MLWDNFKISYRIIQERPWDRPQWIQVNISFIFTDQLYLCIFYHKSWDGSVGVTAKPRDEKPQNCCSRRGWGVSVLSLGPTSLKGPRRSFLEDIWLGCKADHSPLSSPEVKKEWSYNSSLHLPSWNTQRILHQSLIFFHSIKFSDCLNFYPANVKNWVSS